MPRRDRFGATVEGEGKSDTISRITFLSRVNVSNERNSCILNLRLEKLFGYPASPDIYVFLYLSVSTGHQAMKHLDHVVWHHRRLKRWLKFLKAHHFTLQYREGTGNSNADFP